MFYVVVDMYIYTCILLYMYTICTCIYVYTYIYTYMQNLLGRVGTRAWWLSWIRREAAPSCSLDRAVKEVASARGGVHTRATRGP